ncbi:chemotaxis protein CheD [Tangfeifania diversioriginum]|uniref:Probable chemoreceptor glutamine deamidase CheD n=1 Tax=Tangfeifania diversioriginum TaxID=1168035 RepID=A0A1M6NQT8_9BACT|nr:chemotaxis protein CheD [Tangfeifania diversioriginum]SHJ98010.1 chemotaxis protein CheD [Tangfeifania diversioriginum]
MKETITVYTGEIKISDGTTDLKSSPLGSCVVVVLFDEEVSAGGMAHIMLPGKAPVKENVVPGKYAANAIEKLIQDLKAEGLAEEKLKAVVVGGGNVLKRENETIGTDNLFSVYQLLELYKIKLEASSVKGTERKSVRYNTEKGIIYYTKGDGPEKELYRIMRKPQMLIGS